MPKTLDFLGKIEGGKKSVSIVSTVESQAARLTPAARPFILEAEPPEDPPQDGAAAMASYPSNFT